jgi:DHA1 family multidrug resistance protein-like MFS transporter
VRENEWKRTLALMVCVQVSVSASNSFSTPFLPLYLVQLGVHPAAATEYWAGTIFASGALTGAIFAPFLGGIGDRIGRKPMVLRSSLTVCLAMALMGLCTTPLQLLGVRVVTGAFTGFSTAAMALVAAQAPEGRLGYALGWLATGQTAGTLLGPLLGGLLADQLHDYRVVFFVAALATGILAGSAALLVREAPIPRTSTRRERVSIGAQLRDFSRHRRLIPVLLVIVMAQAATMAIQPVLPLFVAHLAGDAPWRATITGTVVAATGFAGLLSAPFLGRRSDRLGYRQVLLVSLTGAACFTLPQAFAFNVWLLLGLRFGLGLFIGGVLPSANALLARLSRPEERGQVYGFTSSANFLGRFAGPLLGALIGAHFGFGAVFLVIGSIMLVNIVWVSRRIEDMPVIAPGDTMTAQ